MRIASLGHAAFAASMMGAGIAGLMTGDFVGVWNGVARSFPARELLAYVCGLVALAGGAGLVWRQSAAFTARALFFVLLLWMLVVKGRYLVAAPLEEGSYQSIGENAVIVAAAWVLYAWFAVDLDNKRLGVMTGDNGVRAARVLYALAMIAFGFSHPAVGLISRAAAT
jgi:hypothetical protein